MKMQRIFRNGFMLFLGLFLSTLAVAYDGPRFQGEVGEDLFRDGSAVVRLAHSTDGDTASFIVGDTVYPTRFLAVNTPETSHPTQGAEPWGQAAKDFTKSLLENADQIVLQLDPESDVFDHYERLLAWVWVDEELLNYRLVEEGYAWVMYLYGDYEYNTVMIRKEAEVRKTKIKIHGEKDPDYDYEKVLQELTIAQAKESGIGSHVRIEGTVTARIGNNAFIQDGDTGIYCYTAGRRWKYLWPGNRVAITAMLGDYNSLLELVNIEAVDIVSENQPVPAPAVLTIAELSEEYEGCLVSIKGATVEEVQKSGGKGYNVVISQDESAGVIRIDQYLVPYIEPEFFIPGKKLDITAPVGQYKDIYQLMLYREEDVRYLE